MKNNWPIKKLGEVAEVYGGGTPLRSNPDYWSNDIPWLTMEDINSKFYVGGTVQYISNLGLEKSNAQLVPVGSVVLSSTASVGNVAINTIPLATNQQFNSFHPKDELLTEFLAYYLIFDKEKIKRLGGSTTFQFISKTTISSFGIPIPPINIQKQIVEKLDAIRKAQELIGLQIQKIEELFDSLIFKEVEKSDAETFELGDICRPQYGYTQSAKDIGKYRFIRITDIGDDGELRNNDNKYISDDYSIIKSYILNIGDLLIARTGATYGKVLYFDQKDPAIFASFLIRLNPDESKILPKFLWLFSRSNLYWEQAERLASGTGQPQFNANKIKEIKIKVPSLEKQNKIIEKLGAIQEYKKILQKQKQLYKELFDSVLNKSMKGDI